MSVTTHRNGLMKVLIKTRLFVPCELGSAFRSQGPEISKVYIVIKLLNFSVRLLLF